jgi:transglutaminase-like putative cysteine protease
MRPDTGNIAKEKFSELTAGFSPEKAAVRVFNFIRDIPYRIDPEQFDLDKGPEGMILSGRGSCFPKHYLLGSMLEKLGFTVKYSVYPFYWKDQILPMPEEVTFRSGKIPVTYHLACRVVSGEGNFTIDATWNPALSRAGFIVNENWDVKSSTRLAVETKEEIKVESASSAAKLVQERFDLYTLGERLELSRFTIEFNRWMENLEKGEGK